MLMRWMTGLVGLGLATAVFADQPIRFDASLVNFNAGGAPTNSNAAGQATVEIVDDESAIYYQVEVAGLTNAFMAHIHVSPVPVQATDPAGPIIFWFFGGPPPSGGNAIEERINGSLARGYINADSNLASGTLADLIAAIKEGRATVVAHTTQNPAGEIRGTLR
jgi:hypothetical protein